MVTETKETKTEMKLFAEAKNQIAYLKAGFLGFPGSGKTYTASELAIGLVKLIRDKRPVAFFDTESGSDYVIKNFQKADIKLVITKRRSFASLLEAVKEAEKYCSVLIVDSISHVWNDLVEEYKRQKNQDRLYVQDFGILKPQWQKYTDLYLNSNLHIIVCGRAAFDWEMERNDQGKLEANKTGTIHMKVESEFGYEPSLLVEMERVDLRQTLKKKGQIGKKNANLVHRAFVIKDRADLLNGQIFDDPTFDTFLPSVKALNIGGEHLAVDTRSDTGAMFDKDTKDFDWQKEQKQKDVFLEEIEGNLVSVLPGSTGQDRSMKLLILEFVFKTKSWEKIKQLSSGDLGLGLTEIKRILMDGERMTTFRAQAELLQKQGKAKLE